MATLLSEGKGTGRRSDSEGPENPARDSYLARPPGRWGTPTVHFRSVLGSAQPTCRTCSVSVCPVEGKSQEADSSCCAYYPDQRSYLHGATPSRPPQVLGG